jgi:D-alanyl-D-alanine carboxypeptidase
VGIRRVLLILSTALATAVGVVAIGPVVWAPRASELAATIPTAPLTVTTFATPRPEATSSSTLAPPTMPASPSTVPSSSPGPLAGAPPMGEGPISITQPRLARTTRLALQARLDRLRERYAIPGISVAIVLPDGSTWLGVSGMADVESETAVSRSTAFAVASISKTFTAALVLALAQEGRIDLDAPVRRYLPGLTKVSSKVRVRQLLDHTSGLRDYFFHPSIDRQLLSTPARRWDSARALRYVGKAYFQPGKGWHYSNTNYLVLGMLAEVVGKAPLADQVRTRFLRPLDLDHTWYQPDEKAAADVAHGYRFTSASKAAKPIDLSDGTSVVPFTSVVTAAGAAGGFASTAEDLARWGQALYGGDVLAPPYRAAMVDVTRSAAVKSRIPYGYGAQAIEIDGRPSVGHSGRLLGFRSALRYLPDQRISIAVLTNQSRTDPATIVRSLLRLALTPVDERCRCVQRR